MSSGEEGFIEVLAELRALGEASTTIQAHLVEIDARLANLPTSAEVEELRAIVGELQVDVKKLKDFVEGDPPLHDRLVALEDKQQRFEEFTAEREEEIAEEAGVATDEAHRGMAQEEAGALVRGSEKLTEALADERNQKVLDRFDRDEGVVATLVKAVVNLQSHKMLSTTIAGLVLAVVLFIGAAALWGAPSLP